MLVNEWQEHPGETAWRSVPDYVKKYLIDRRGHSCEVCKQSEHDSNPIPLDIIYRDGNSYNNREENLLLICPNCRALKHSTKGN